MIAFRHCRGTLLTCPNRDTLSRTCPVAAWRVPNVGPRHMCLVTDSGSTVSATTDLEDCVDHSMMHPSVRYQPRLPTKDRKQLRTQAETLAKDKKLINLQVGSQGITPNFMSACMDVLLKHEFVRLRLGEGCGYGRSDAKQQILSLLDCVAVHEVGFTITLYRQKGLPRPDSCPMPASDDSVERVQAAQSTHVDNAQSRQPAIKLHQLHVAEQKLQRHLGPQGPPQFEVL